MKQDQFIQLTGREWGAGHKFVALPLSLHPSAVAPLPSCGHVTARDSNDNLVERASLSHSWKEGEQEVLRGHPEWQGWVQTEGQSQEPSSALGE